MAVRALPIGFDAFDRVPLRVRGATGAAWLHALG